MVKALKPVLTRAAGVPMPDDSVFDAVERLHAELTEVRGAAHRARRVACGWCSRRSPSCWPRRAVAARRCRCSATASTASSPTGSSPRRGADAWRRRLGRRAGPRSWPRSTQSFARLPIWRSAYRSAEPVGVDGARRPRRRAVRRHRPARRRRTVPDPFRGHAAPGRAPCCGSRCRSSPGRGRPGAPRRRAGRDRRVVSSAAHAARRAGAAPGRRGPGGATVSCRCRFEEGTA